MARPLLAVIWGALALAAAAGPADPRSGVLKEIPAPNLALSLDGRAGRDDADLQLAATVFSTSQTVQSPSSHRAVLPTTQKAPAPQADPAVGGEGFVTVEEREIYPPFIHQINEDGSPFQYVPAPVVQQQVKLPPQRPRRPPPPVRGLPRRRTPARRPPRPFDVRRPAAPRGAPRRQPPTTQRRQQRPLSRRGEHIFQRGRRPLQPEPNRRRSRREVDLVRVDINDEDGTLAPGDVLINLESFEPDLSRQQVVRSSRAAPRAIHSERRPATPATRRVARSTSNNLPWWSRLPIVSSFVYSSRPLFTTLEGEENTPAYDASGRGQLAKRSQKLIKRSGSTYLRRNDHLLPVPRNPPDAYVLFDDRGEPYYQTPGHAAQAIYESIPDIAKPVLNPTGDFVVPDDFVNAFRGSGYRYDINRPGFQYSNRVPFLPTPFHPEASTVGRTTFARRDNRLKADDPRPTRETNAPVGREVEDPARAGEEITIVETGEHFAVISGDPSEFIELDHIGAPEQSGTEDGQTSRANDNSKETSLATLLRTAGVSETSPPGATTTQTRVKREAAPPARWRHRTRYRRPPPPRLLPQWRRQDSVPRIPPPHRPQSHPHFHTPNFAPSWDQGGYNVENEREPGQVVQLPVLRTEEAYESHNDEEHLREKYEDDNRHPSLVRPQQREQTPFFNQQGSLRPGTNQPVDEFFIAYDDQKPAAIDHDFAEHNVRPNTPSSDLQFGFRPVDVPRETPNVKQESQYFEASASLGDHVIRTVVPQAIERQTPAISSFSVRSTPPRTTNQQDRRHGSTATIITSSPVHPISPETSRPVPPHRPVLKVDNSPLTSRTVSPPIQTNIKQTSVRQPPESQTFENEVIRQFTGSSILTSGSTVSPLPEEDSLTPENPAKNLVVQSDLHTSASEFATSPQGAPNTNAPVRARERNNRKGSQETTVVNTPQAASLRRQPRPRIQPALANGNPADVHIKVKRYKKRQRRPQQSSSTSARTPTTSEKKSRRPNSKRRRIVTTTVAPTVHHDNVRIRASSSSPQPVQTERGSVAQISYGSRLRPSGVRRRRPPQAANTEAYTQSVVNQPESITTATSPPGVTAAEPETHEARYGPRDVSGGLGPASSDDLEPLILTEAGQLGEASSLHVTRSKPLTEQPRQTATETPTTTTSGTSTTQLRTTTPTTTVRTRVDDSEEAKDEGPRRSVNRPRVPLPSRRKNPPPQTTPADIPVVATIPPPYPLAETPTAEPEESSDAHSQLQDYLSKYAAKYGLGLVTTPKPEPTERPTTRDPAVPVSGLRWRHLVNKRVTTSSPATDTDDDYDDLIPADDDERVIQGSQYSYRTVLPPIRRVPPPLGTPRRERPQASRLAQLLGTSSRLKTTTPKPQIRWPAGYTPFQVVETTTRSSNRWTRQQDNPADQTSVLSQSSAPAWSRYADELTTTKKTAIETETSEPAPVRSRPIFIPPINRQRIRSRPLTFLQANRQPEVVAEVVDAPVTETDITVGTTTESPEVSLLVNDTGSGDSHEVGFGTEENEILIESRDVLDETPTSGVLGHSSDEDTAVETTDSLEFSVESEPIDEDLISQDEESEHDLSQHDPVGESSLFSLVISKERPHAQPPQPEIFDRLNRLLVANGEAPPEPITAESVYGAATATLLDQSREDSFSVTVGTSQDFAPSPTASDNAQEQASSEDESADDAVASDGAVIVRARPGSTGQGSWVPTVTAVSAVSDTEKAAPSQSTQGTVVVYPHGEQYHSHANADLMLSGDEALVSQEGKVPVEIDVSISDDSLGDEVIYFEDENSGEEDDDDLDDTELLEQTPNEQGTYFTAAGDEGRSSGAEWELDPEHQNQESYSANGAQRSTKHDTEELPLVSDNPDYEPEAASSAVVEVAVPQYDPYGVFWSSPTGATNEEQAESQLLVGEFSSEDSEEVQQKATSVERTINMCLDGKCMLIYEPGRQVRVNN